MQVLKKIAPMLCLSTRTPLFYFANNWKDRDEASEKVYITEAESNLYVIVEDTLKKLLKKVEIESNERLQSNSEF